MAKKVAPLPKRLTRYVTINRLHLGIVAATLRPADEDKSEFEVCWQVLQAACPLDVADVADLTERLTRLPAFGSDDATGWVAGLLGRSVGVADPLADRKLRGIEDEVIAALGPAARWHVNGDHPIPELHPDRRRWGWNSITTATFERVLVARGGGLDLVLAWTGED